VKSNIKNSILKFADDTKVSGRVLNQTECSQLQEDINNLIKWSDDWQMSFNVAKCKVMYFGSSNLQ